MFLFEYHLNFIQVVGEWFCFSIVDGVFPKDMVKGNVLATANVFIVDLNEETTAGLA